VAARPPPQFDAAIVLIVAYFVLCLAFCLLFLLA
jgi:hypothetical protein